MIEKNLEAARCMGVRILNIFYAVVGKQEGMHEPRIGMRVALAIGAQGNGVSGESGDGTIREMPCVLCECSGLCLVIRAFSVSACSEVLCQVLMWILRVGLWRMESPQKGKTAQSARYLV